MSDQKTAKAKEDYNWYQKLRLSDKYKFNGILGMFLITLSLILFSTAAIFYTREGLWIVYFVVAIVSLNIGLWFYARGIAYQSQLDAIRIMKRSGGNRNRPANKKQAPKG